MIGVTFAGAALLLAAAGMERVGDRAAFTGAERCKLCHRAIYLAWQATAHRRAGERLAASERSTACLRCHATGPSALSGVQCEACHGAGGNYWPAEVMLDPDKARQAGLIEPTEPVCRLCHGSGLPNHAAEFKMPEGPALSRAVH